MDGTVPETVCSTETGLLVGSTRGGAYVCSNDCGATWSEILGLPECEYQPFIIAVSDGRFLCAWHKYGDCAFGEHHQFVGQHGFSLDAAELREAPLLELTRDLDENKTYYTNTYTAHLPACGEDLPNRDVRFHTQMRYRDTYDLSPPAPEPREVTVKTDEEGRARLDMGVLYPEIARELNIHQAVETKAFFAPAEGERFCAAESTRYRSYPLTPAIGKANNCPLYVAGRKLSVSPEVLGELAMIGEIVEKIGTPRRIDAARSKRDLGLSDVRFEEVMEYLTNMNVLSKQSDGYEWRHDLSGGWSEIEVEDDFV